MRKKTEYTNWAASDAEYIDGKAQNKTLSISGTKWNEELMGDFLQTLLKACRDSGLTDASKNNLPDNETNGYELFNALKYSFNAGDWTEVTVFDGDNTQYAGASYNPLHVRKVGDMVEITGAYNNGSTGNGFTLPVGFRPAKSLYIQSIWSGANQDFRIDPNGSVFVEGGSIFGTFVFSSSFCISDLS